MPIYVFYNPHTGVEWEELMSISKMERFLETHPWCELRIQAPNIVGGHGDRVKIDGGMKDVFSRVAEAHPNSPLAERYGSGRSGKSKKVEDIGKKHGLIRKDGSQNVGKFGSKVSNYK